MSNKKVFVVFDKKNDFVGRYDTIDEAGENMTPGESYSIITGTERTASLSTKISIERQKRTKKASDAAPKKRKNGVSATINCKTDGCTEQAPARGRYAGKCPKHGGKAEATASA